MGEKKHTLIHISYPVFREVLLNIFIFAAQLPYLCFSFDTLDLEKRTIIHKSTPI